MVYYLMFCHSAPLIKEIENMIDYFFPDNELWFNETGLNPPALLHTTDRLSWACHLGNESRDCSIRTTTVMEHQAKARR
ncbi:uncharacterized protein N7479_008635 [Penicillium vulpinum]|uniref:uncharacterized protein n=1 Tax=Penicillium vulpinum TaxID=29845 RepID=UPI00254748FE|nr:uncharacterized protein N7479_008635 [Penicillium vulpinum]KAJ5950222.1 hypothetical protein N7479_008635 [Penicillium vulpinum]